LIIPFFNCFRADGTYPRGFTLRKLFEGYGYYRGTVKSFDDEHRLYWIHYTYDDDFEELDSVEIGNYPDDDETADFLSLRTTSETNTESNNSPRRIPREIVITSKSSMASSNIDSDEGTANTKTVWI